MRTLHRSRLGRFLCALGVLLASTLYAAEARVYSVRGVVRAPFEDGAITIQHEEIPGFMPAMTMPFYVDAAEANALSPGDRVEFEFHVGERSRATKFRKIGQAETTPPPPTTSAAAAPARKRLRAGDPLPSFTLTDQDNRTMTDADLRGRSTIVTFVFTRCPVPEFCPLIGKRFQALQSALSTQAGLPASDVQFLSISIDPEHDRPAVLRSYGESLGADFARWRFATGAVEEIEKLTRAFAVRTERNGATLDHTLATALIGPDGKVQEIWRGNAWKPEEVLARVMGTARP